MRNIKWNFSRIVDREDRNKIEFIWEENQNEIELIENKKRETEKENEWRWEDFE